jgi:hemerythrin-like metal-binding protein
VSQEIALGVASIDAQHQELVDLFDQFEHCIKSDVSRDEVQGVIDRALACANAHFEHEEELIARTRYPKAEEHKFEHRHLRIQFTTLVGSALAILSHDPVAREQLGVMRGLLLDHIVGPDRELAAHLNAAGIK